MNDFPIIMSAPMVQAILREIAKPGTGKTETRRLLWAQRKAGRRSPTMLQRYKPTAKLAPGKRHALTGWDLVRPGDRLWVRENISAAKVANILTGEPLKGDYWEAKYEADNSDVVDQAGFNIVPWWKHAPGTLPCIHMPRRYSRLTLTVAAGGVERLQDIDYAAAMREGIRHRILKIDDGSGGHHFDDCYSDDFDRGASPDPIGAYRLLWCWLHGRESWDENPWVVPITFTPALCNIDRMEADATSN